MKPTVTATASMVEGSDRAIAVLLEKKEEAIKKTDVWQMYVGESGDGDRDRWYKYTHDNASPSNEGFFEGIGNDIKFAMSKASYNFRNSVKEWMSEVLRVLFEAAALCIDTLRTFQLVVLAILGPLVFGIAVFDGFQHTLTVWIARYINIFLWLPVANIFGSIIGKIQEKMLEMDIAQVQDYGDTFFSRTDMAYLVFHDHWHCGILYRPFGSQLHCPCGRWRCFGTESHQYFQQFLQSGYGSSYRRSQYGGGCNGQCCQPYFPEYGQQWDYQSLFQGWQFGWQWLRLYE